MWHRLCIRGGGVVCIALILALQMSPTNSAMSGRHENCSWMPTGQIGDVIWGNDQFVAVGASGIVLTSPDGLYWSIERPDGALWGQQTREACQESLQSVAWGNGIYLASGNQQRLLMSKDGKTWSEAPPISPDLRGGVFLTWANGLFVAVGAAGRIYTSPDGLTWLRRETGLTDQLVDVAGYHKGFMAISKSGKVLASDDGVHWTVSDSGSARLDRLVTQGNLALAIGNLGYGTAVTRSNDGRGWSVKEYHGFEHLYNDVIWSDGLFVLGGTDLAISGRGIEWTFLRARTTSPGVSHWMRLAGNGKVFVAIGLRGELAASYDGANWFGGPLYLLDQGARHYRVSGEWLSEDAAVETSAVLREWMNQVSVSGPAWRGITVATLALYLLLQVFVVIQTSGAWRIVAVIPGLFLLGPVAYQILIASFFSGRALWPMWLVRPGDWRVPVAAASLLLIFGIWTLTAKGLIRWTPTPGNDASASFRYRYLLGWALLGIASGTSSAMNAMFLPILLQSAGEGFLLAKYSRSPISAFFVSLGAGILVSMLVLVISTPFIVSGVALIPKEALMLLMIGIPLIPPWLCFAAIAGGQYMFFTQEGGTCLRYWVPIKALAALAITLLVTKLPGWGGLPAYGGTTTLVLNFAFYSGLSILLGLYQVFSLGQGKAE